MYQIIVTSINGKRYYHSYVESDGNIECDDLPPFQDINKARACYWNDEQWLFDGTRYDEILAEIEAKKQAAQEEADRQAAIPNNEQLNEMMLCLMTATNEIALYMDSVVEPLTDMAALLVKGE